MSFCLNPFSRKTNIADSDMLHGLTDHHSHLLPGVDDGVKTLPETLDILAEMERSGIVEVWLTPHIMEDMPNTTAALKQKFAALQTAYHGTVQLHLAAEYMMDTLFEERLARKDLLPIGPNGDHLLVETSCFNPPIGWRNTLLRIKSAGYHPLLAHPERYAYLDADHYDRLHEQGIRFQLNLFSLAGAYGPEARNKARHLLARGYYHCAGTDTHSRRQFEQATQAKKLAKKEIKLFARYLSR